MTEYITTTTSAGGKSVKSVCQRHVNKAIQYIEQEARGVAKLGVDCHRVVEMNW